MLELRQDSKIKIESNKEKLFSMYELQTKITRAI